jgi:cell division cycle 20-like protein 1, cofactor of APC complex
MEQDSLDVSNEMICEDMLPCQQQHNTPKQISPTADCCDTAASTPATASSSQSSPYFSASASPRRSFAGSNFLAWSSMPSPSRPVLDPRYAARLPLMHSSTTLAPSIELMPPPVVRRCETSTSLQTSNAEMFRPTPIITPMAHVCPERYDSFDSEIDERWTPRRPSPKRTRSEHAGYGDRFIPNRATSNFNINLWEGISERSAAARARRSSHFHHSNSTFDADMSEHSNRSNNNPESPGAGVSAGEASSGANGSTPSAVANTFAAAAQQNLHNTLLRTELLGENEDLSRVGLNLSQPLNNHMRFSIPRHALLEQVMDPTSVVNAFSLTPINNASERLITTPNKRKRRISKVPFKVLDAPALQDDFYLNLVDWSSHNVLAVGLGACVYLWSACTSKVTKLCDLSVNTDTVTAVSWAQRGTHLSVGTDKGEVQLWDTIKCKKVRSMAGHSARVGTLAWTGPILASGSRDRLIYLRDVRVQAPFTDKLSNHRQEVCGLKWSFDEPAFLASGGNDNNLHVIDSRNPTEPLHKFTEHTAAVKAIAWSPHQHGLLASGGGTADRCIRFWNTLSGSSLNKIDTGSQVCNLAWSQNCNEMVSTHGYSLNQIVVWRYPSMSKVTTLTGHTFRVLYLAMSPDGSTVVTGAGDETLRFWQIFPGPRADGKDSTGGLLFPNTLGSVIR